MIKLILITFLFAGSVRGQITDPMYWQDVDTIPMRYSYGYVDSPDDTVVCVIIEGNDTNIVPINKVLGQRIRVVRVPNEYPEARYIQGYLFDEEKVFEIKYYLKPDNPDLSTLGVGSGIFFQRYYAGRYE